MSEYKPKVGDRVRIVLEGEVSNTPNFVPDFKIRGQHGSEDWVQPQAEYVVSVEKLAPPVETFKPGDSIRYVVDGSIHHVGVGGCLVNGQWRPHGSTHDSSRFERVVL